MIRSLLCKRPVGPAMGQKVCARLGWAGLVGALGVWIGLAAPAWADNVEGSAPALSGVAEFLVQPVRAGGTSGAGSTNLCAVARGEIDTALLRVMKNYGLPAIPTAGAKPARLDNPRVDLVPEVVTANNADSSECSTWVSLSVQSNSTVRIAPINTPRNVVVTYWRGGLLVNSSPTANIRSLNDALDKLARQLAQQYKLDQPPALPDFSDTKE